jgi:methylmalonyl-CoA/ethylmalonyl-CoA epimerase
MSQKPFKILSIEHVGIAVDDLNGISDVFGDLLGLELRSREKIDDQQVITDIYETGSGKLEFLKATSKDSPIARFIDKKSSGIHHIALLVDHLQPALDYLKDQGVQLIDEKPRIGAEGLSIAFIHPKSTGGILVELCEKSKN